MKVGFHAPLPPARTGVADYAFALYGALARYGTVLPDARAAAVHLYHLGNNGLHRAIYARALRKPGVVVLHDAVLHHFFLGSMNEQEYVDEFTYNYGAWTRSLARELWRTRARSAGDRLFFEYPMVRRIAERSRVIVVHNPAAASIVRRHAPAARVVEIPHLFEGTEAPPLAPGRATFGLFGYLRESKRVMTVLRAFERVRNAYPSARLIIAGEWASSDLRVAAAPLLDRPGITELGYLSDAEFDSVASAVRACVNLRYPAAGETSGIAVRVMGLGRAVIITAGEEYSRVPPAACVRLEHGIHEQETLEALMMWLCDRPLAAREIGSCAAEYIRSHHSLNAVAAQYWQVLRDACD